MQRRVEAPDSLDYFPTPPWATRAVIPHLLSLDPALGSSLIWEPGCGEGHMAEALRETGATVCATDVHDYGYGDGVLDALDRVAVVDRFGPKQPDWLITNPPFKVAVEFAELGLWCALRGVALLVRTSWLEGGDRFRRLYQPNPPALILQYSERVPMTEGRWDPDASTATSYCWVIWVCGSTETRFGWIEPGQRKALTHPDDASRFGVRTEAPLLGDPA